MNEGKILLDIRDLTVHYITYDGTVRAVENLSLSLKYGETRARR